MRTREYHCKDGLHSLLIADDGRDMYAHLLRNYELISEKAVCSTPDNELYTGSSGGIPESRLPLSLLWEFDDGRLESVWLVFRHSGFRLFASSYDTCGVKKTETYGENGLRKKR